MSKSIYLNTVEGMNNHFVLDAKRSYLRASCCDCNLVHKFDFRLVGNALHITVTRDDRWAKWRKRNGKKVRNR